MSSKYTDNFDDEPQILNEDDSSKNNLAESVSQCIKWHEKIDEAIFRCIERIEEKENDPHWGSTEPRDHCSQQSTINVQTEHHKMLSRGIPFDSDFRYIFEFLSASVNLQKLMMSKTPAISDMSQHLIETLREVYEENLDLRKI